MALATNPVDINRATSGLSLPAEIAQEIFENARHESAVMRLADRIELPGRGLAIPVITGDPIAAMVAETAEKPVSNSTFETKTMKPQKFAVIELVSKELMRDMPVLYDTLVKRLPYSIAKAFDNQVFNGTAVTGFDSLANVQAVQRSAGDNIAEVVRSGMMLVGAANGHVDGFAVSPAYETELVTAIDGINRPLLIQSMNDGDYVGRVYGADVAETAAISTMFGGDWTKAKYGIVNDIEISISRDATINTGTELVNTFQRNMVAILVEAELGFVCANANAFFKVTAA